MDSNLLDILKNVAKMRKAAKPIKKPSPAYNAALERLYGTPATQPTPEEKAPDKSLLSGIVGDSLDFYK